MEGKITIKSVMYLGGSSHHSMDRDVYLVAFDYVNRYAHCPLLVLVDEVEDIDHRSEYLSVRNILRTKFSARNSSEFVSMEVPEEDLPSEDDLQEALEAMLTREMLVEMSGRFRTVVNS